jgi:hypothetical protein
MIIPVVTAAIDPAAIEVLITSCAEYHRLRAQAAARHDDQPGTPDTTPTHAGQDDGPAGAAHPGRTAEVLALLEHQILAAVIQVVSGPGGVASFLRRNLLGKGLNGPSLPLDVGATDEIPVTCGGWSRCGTRPAATRAAAPSPRDLANRTMWCTGPTAGTPACTDSRTGATGTTTSCSTNWAGNSPSTPTAPARSPAQPGRPSEATARHHAPAPGSGRAAA